MRFAFRCPLVWDQPPTEERRWCGQCDRWVYDLFVLPDLDVPRWIEEHPGACVRAPVDREGNLLPRTPLRTAAVVAVASQPCAAEPLIELDPPVCEVRTLDREEEVEPGSSETPLPERPPVEVTLALGGEVAWAPGLVSAGVPGHEPISAPPPPLPLPPVFVRPVPAPEVAPRPEPVRERGLWKRLFGRKRNR
jgi:hypothetical protein